MFDYWCCWEGVTSNITTQRNICSVTSCTTNEKKLFIHERVAVINKKYSDAQNKWCRSLVWQGFWVHNISDSQIKYQLEKVAWRLMWQWDKFRFVRRTPVILRVVLVPWWQTRDCCYFSSYSKFVVITETWKLRHYFIFGAPLVLWRCTRNLLYCEDAQGTFSIIKIIVNLCYCQDTLTNFGIVKIIDNLWYCQNNIQFLVLSRCIAPFGFDNELWVLGKA